jgi:hypothetical protein
VIDGDVLVDTNFGRWSDLEISIADLEFDLKQSLSPAGTAAALIARTGGRSSDKEAIIAEAQRRVAADESIPPTLAVANCVSGLRQPRVLRGTKTGRVLGPASIEEHLRPLWRKYSGGHPKIQRDAYELPQQQHDAAEIWSSLDTNPGEWGA